MALTPGYFKSRKIGITPLISSLKRHKLLIPTAQKPHFKRKLNKSKSFVPSGPEAQRSLPTLKVI